MQIPIHEKDRLIALQIHEKKKRQGTHRTGFLVHNIYSTTKETRQFLICPRYVIYLVKIQNLVIGHGKQLNLNKANEI